MPSEEELIAERKRKRDELITAGINPYPYKYDRTHKNEDIHTKYQKLNADESTKDSVKIAGRIVSMRRMGKVTFMHILDETHKLQVFVSEENMLEQYRLLKLFDLGDWIGVEGTVFKTKAGELTVNAAHFEMLCKTIRPMPEKWHGLKDKELRYRKRYLDLIMNPTVKETFRKRAIILNEVRNELNERGFTEVETPVLQPLYGGTNAKPFKTFINAFKEDVYLRVAPELYLKRLVVGGFGKVYEVAKNFRNEGADLTHNPEFTMLEFYEAYADYHVMMNTAESMYKRIAKKLFGELKVPKNGRIIDLSGDWPRIPMIDAIKDYAKVDVEKMSDDELKAFVDERGFDHRGQASRGILINAIFEKMVTDKLAGPLWIIDYPKEISPLSKPHRSKDGWVERFECYVDGMELGDGWSEIIDPVDQRNRFESEQQAMRDGDVEAHPLDEDFIEALEYGMPVLGGIGIGIDRLTMFFTDNSSIRDVMLFPFMKPLHKKEECFESPDYDPEAKRSA
ncbi:lysine--tRNA ligase [Candidatus Woesearchaeota archaeon CG10_big_fil_rev_8_21_14_0_10_37_12]|nr:MAG: lysine--tRNA ligase [Candidatus Woesearchaeota archaeon CG10_big_fil_rev_8_21_14_0_10_37_12]